MGLEIRKIALITGPSEKVGQKLHRVCADTRDFVINTLVVLTQRFASFFNVLADLVPNF